MTRPTDDPRALLAEMQRDRAALSERAKTPRWFSLAAGLVLAGWVASPALSPERSSTPYLFAVVAVLLLIGTARQSTGVRHSGLGRRGWLVGLALLVSTLALYSTSLALVSLDLARWVVAPSLAMFGAGWVGTRAMNRAAREELREVR